MVHPSYVDRMNTFLPEGMSCIGFLPDNIFHPCLITNAKTGR